MKTKYQNKIKEEIAVLRDEIKWCKKHTKLTSDEYDKGFINGLRQALLLIESVQKYEKNKNHCTHL